MVATDEDCRREGIVFLPLAVETLGGWHPEGAAVVQRLAVALARHTGEDELEQTRFLFQRLAVCLQKGNASLVHNRRQSFPDPQVDGIM